MKCKKQRSIFDLFYFWSCKDCPDLKRDEIINIGRRVVGIYHLTETCRYIIVDDIELFAFSPKLKQLLLEAEAFQEQIVLLILDDLNFEKIDNILEAFLDLNLDVQIIIG
ncbi:MAG TPA: hypothetical protein VJZ51_04280 [Bacilli bacterium]|nr:hypothetical protein [Bacilli bacterium]